MSNHDIKVNDRDLRNFGLLVGLIFFLIGCWPIIRASQPYYWMNGFGLTLIAFGLLKPTLLRRFYKIWMALGLALGWVNTRIILGAIFFGLIAPLAILLRLGGRDLIGRRNFRKKASYWVKREPVNHVESMKQQY